MTVARLTESAARANGRGRTEYRLQFLHNSFLHDSVWPSGRDCLTNLRVTDRSNYEQDSI